MKTIYITAAFLVLACVGIGAWLVVNGHPWFGLVAMFIGCSVKLANQPST